MGLVLPRFVHLNECTYDDDTCVHILTSCYIYIYIYVHSLLCQKRSLASSRMLAHLISCLVYLVDLVYT